jgi:hypothetical protein
MVITSGLQPTWLISDSARVDIISLGQDGDPERAVTQMAQHLAGTALRLMKDCSPDHEPYAVPAAVAMVGAASEARQ